MNASLPEGNYLYLKFVFNDEYSRRAGAVTEQRYAILDRDGTVTSTVTGLLERLSGQAPLPSFPFALLVPHDTSALQTGLKSVFAPMTTSSSASGCLRVAAIIADIVTLPLRLMTLLPRLIYQRCSPQSEEEPINHDRFSDEMSKFKSHTYIWDAVNGLHQLNFFDCGWFASDAKRGGGEICISMQLKPNYSEQLQGALMRNADLGSGDLRFFQVPEKYV